MGIGCLIANVERERRVLKLIDLTTEAGKSYEMCGGASRAHHRRGDAKGSEAGKREPRGSIDGDTVLMLIITMLINVSRLS